MNTLEGYFSEHKERFFEEWRALLSIHSVSADSAFASGCREGASWVQKELTCLGFSVEIIETSGHPVVYGVKKTEKKGARTLLFYGHYDVQPPDPVELWQTKPFEPEIRDERMYARGAQDNKGQLLYFLKAVEALGSNHSLNIKVLIEGEEEIGSKRLTEMLPTIKDRLNADVLLVCDTGTPDERFGAITMGLRGIGHFEIKLTGPKKDLHSGVHGGVVKNPIIELSRMIAALHDESGRVAAPNFYDGAAPITDQERALCRAFDFSHELYKEKVGVLPLGGEKGIPLMERRGLHPTVEVNGMYGGYLGEGSKTIIPSYAVAKFSCRLVAGQNAQKAVQAIVDFLRVKAPQEMEFEVSQMTATGGALKVAPEGVFIKAARDALKEVTGADPILLWEGASIPLIPSLAEVSGATPVLVGFGLEEDNIHAPNESFSLEQFRKGFLFCGVFLGKITGSS